jgi:hypothetical protein
LRKSTALPALALHLDATVAEAGVDPTAEARALQDDLIAAIGSRRG